MLTTPSPPPAHGYPDPAYPGHADEPDDDTWTPALPGQQAALEALMWNWGPAYEIGVDDGEWWYRRRDGKGGRETASNPDDLHTMIITDYSVYPVPREHHITDDTPPTSTAAETPCPPTPPPSPTTTI
jgi:hypothetical protein